MIKSFILNFLRYFRIISDLEKDPGCNFDKSESIFSRNGLTAIRFIEKWVPWGPNNGPSRGPDNQIYHQIDNQIDQIDHPINDHPINDHPILILIEIEIEIDHPIDHLKMDPLGPMEARPTCFFYAIFELFSGPGKGSAMSFR